MTDSSNYSEEQAVRNLLISLGYTNPTQADIDEALRQSLALDVDMATMTEQAPRTSNLQPAVASYLDESFERRDDSEAGEAHRVKGYAAPQAIHRPRNNVDVKDSRIRGEDAFSGPAVVLSGLHDEPVQRSSANASDVPDDSFGEKREGQAAFMNGEQKHEVNYRPVTKGSRSKRPASGRVAFEEVQREWDQRRNQHAVDEYRHQRPFNPHSEIDASVLGRIAKLQDEIRHRIASQPPTAAARDDSSRRPKSAHKRTSPPQQARTPLMHYARNSANVIYAFTGNRQYLAGTHSALQNQVAERRSTDPVRRGQAMRELWKKDQFLMQKGRADERWRVRQSMLSWDGQGI